MKKVRDELQREYVLFRLHGVTSQLETSSALRATAVADREAVVEQIESEKQTFEAPPGPRGWRRCWQAAEGDRRKARAESQQVEKSAVGVKAKLEWAARGV